MTQQLENRFYEHNSFQNKSTKAFSPWVMIHSEEFGTREAARQKEIKLKSSSGRRFIRKNYLTSL